MFLVESGANLEDECAYNFTPLIYATFQNKAKVAEFLVNKGAKINAQTTRGDTALIFAAYNNNLELTKFLLSKGADPSIKGRFWRTAYSTTKNPLIKKLLQ